MLQILDHFHPDVVDVYEDALAAKLGLCQHPNCDQAAWREARVAFITENGGDLTEEEISLLFPEDSRPAKS